MAQPSPTPSLTPQFCFNQTALRDFLRLSRSTIDDSITQNLNALRTPATHAFDPTSTSTRHLQPATLAPAVCDTFTQRVLFPSWAARADVLDYCGRVAASPDPGDPDSVLRAAEDGRARARVVDERLDPYSGRYFAREARVEGLAALVRNERAVEGIVRARSWGAVRERCGGVMGEAEEVFGTWREGSRR